jgi:hypothetical protein
MSNLVFTPTSKITLTWDAAVPTSEADGDQILGYDVIVTSAGSDPVTVLNTPTLSATLTMGNLPSIAFDVTVLAVSKAGRASQPSNVVSFRPATAPNAPTNLRGAVAWS